MKTSAALLLATSLSFSLAACGDHGNWDGDGFDDAGAADGGTDGEDGDGGEGGGEGGAGEGGGDGGGGEDDDGRIRVCVGDDCHDGGDKPGTVIFVPPCEGDDCEDHDCEDDGGIIACRPAEVALIAGQHFDAGLVDVSTTDEGLLVEIETIDGWTMQQLHVFAGVDVPGQNPGSYPFAEGLDHANKVSMTIPFDALEAQCGDVLLVAVHAEVSKPVEGDKQCQQETAWGEGEQTFEQGWGGYFEVTLCCD